MGATLFLTSEARDSRKWPMRSKATLRTDRARARDFTPSRAAFLKARFFGMTGEMRVGPACPTSTAPCLSVTGITGSATVRSTAVAPGQLVTLFGGGIGPNTAASFPVAAVERSENKSSRDSIFEACMLRLRPILMTTMAAMLGALHLALGAGIGSELRRPLGITIIGGLVVSQMLTLFTTPVVYLYFDRLSHWRQKEKPHRGDLRRALENFRRQAAHTAGYRTLARNIQAAWIAHRMGLSIQTVLRKYRKELNDEDPHASWLEFAQMVDEGARAAFKKRYGPVQKRTIQ